MIQEVVEEFLHPRAGMRKVVDVDMVTSLLTGMIVVSMIVMIRDAVGVVVLTGLIVLLDVIIPQCSVSTS